jgi:hypothetical protein
MPRIEDREIYPHALGPLDSEPRHMRDEVNIVAEELGATPAPRALL